MRTKLFVLSVVALVCAIMPVTAIAQTTDDLLFIHHSCGANWLSSGLHNALQAKDYIDERNDCYYGTDVTPDAGRPDSLAPNPGDSTYMDHWVEWFNDYLGSARALGCSDGVNKIIMFKSCYPASNIGSVGTGGDPFNSTNTIVNYQAVYRHPNGPGNTYSHNSTTYKPLEDIFAENPDTLFIPVTAPPLCYGNSIANAARARDFNNWLKTDWQASYNLANPDLNNVAVFDWFDVLANPDDAVDYPNLLRSAYGGTSGNSHPNSVGNSASTVVFATETDNFIDTAWELFVGGPRMDGDLNNDGFVGGEDLNIVLSYWGQTVVRGSWLQGDWSGDGFVGGTDLNAVLGHWGDMAPPSVGIPEPATITIIGFGAAALLRRRLKR